jgi:hypothetical protein
MLMDRSITQRSLGGAAFAVSILLLLVVALASCNSNDTALLRRSWSTLLIGVSAASGHRMLRIDPKTVESKTVATTVASTVATAVDSQNLPAVPRAFYTDETFKSFCCLNNSFLSTNYYVWNACKLADRPADVVILPPDLEGAFLTTFKLFEPQDIEKLQKLAKETLNCNIVHASQVQADSYQMTKLAETRLVLNNPIAHWFYDTMKLPQHLQKAWNTCYASFINKEPYTAVHLRIEDDWERLKCETWGSDRPGKICYSPAETASAVSTLDGASPQKVVFIHGKPTAKYDDGTGDSPLEVWTKFNPKQKVLHKSQSPTCRAELEILTYNDNAMLDMWVAIQSTLFVGHMASSFSNAVTLTRRVRDANSADYTYVCPEMKELILRRDNGSVMGVGEVACTIATREPRDNIQLRAN